MPYLAYCKVPADKVEHFIRTRNTCIDDMREEKKCENECVCQIKCCGCNDDDCDDNKCECQFAQHNTRYKKN